MMPSTLAIITDMFGDPAERQRAIGVWAGTSGVGIALGPIVGGLLLARFWWGSVFLINMPIAVLGAACALCLIPDSRNPAAQAPDLAGSVLSVTGLGLVLWSLIEAPVRGWSSPVVIGAGAGGLAVLAVFAAWERVSSHPMLNVGFFRRRRFSAAVGSLGLVTFGLFGTRFVMTQFLQFVASGLWQLSTATAATTFTGVLPGLILLGVGAGLAIPSATESVMGSLPAEHTGVGSATNGAFLQIGGALGVAVIGSLLNTRYQDTMTSTLAPYHVPHTVMHGGSVLTRHPGGRGRAWRRPTCRSRRTAPARPPTGCSSRCRPCR
jgi:hypothetical protein